MKQKSFTCSNPNCRKLFTRLLSATKKSQNLYCSSSCAASVNNKKFPKRQAPIKICIACGKKYTYKGNKKYCSRTCKITNQTLTNENIITAITKFYLKHERIPLKREFAHARAAREHFGTWNNAIITAGLEPNPVMFAKKYRAKDNHMCDSLAERIIDDWLYRRNILHERTVVYPSNSRLTTDFLIGDTWIEFFGLFGKHKRYDELREQKLQIVKQHKLKFIEIYPHHLFPKNKLHEVLTNLFAPSP